MVDEVVSSPERYLTDSRWEAAFRRVPRHRFLSGFYIATQDAQRRWEFVDPAADAERWMRLAYDDMPRLTRMDEYEKPLSSSSAPLMMARFLHLLDVHAAPAHLQTVADAAQYVQLAVPQESGITGV